MIKLSNVKWIAAAIVTGMLTLTTASCSKDDPSLHDKQVDIWELGNDLTELNKVGPYYLNVYGSVKSLTLSHHYNAKWENNAITEGDVGMQYIHEFDNNGYYTKLTQKTIYNFDGTSKLTPNSETTYTSRDNRHRETETLEVLWYSYNSDGTVNKTNSQYYKNTYTYDDNAKTATQIRTQSTDGGTSYGKDISKTVFQLNKYGRIDAGNSQYYPAKSGFEETPSNETITKYDDKGNKILYYQKSTFSGNTNIHSYIKATYVYY